MQKRSAAALINHHGLRRCITKALASMLCFVLAVSVIAAPSVANANFTNFNVYNSEALWAWITGSSSEPLGGWTPVGAMDALFSVNKPQKYYTTPTSSVQDKYGNVTNYYRGGDTTNTNIIDSYNKTFNTIWNTTNNSTTNNYQANVKLENFLNQYTTNNVTNNNTYTANFKSWYYDNTTNNYNYNEFNKYDTTNNYLYYNQDNSRYYISIDNSTDEYYLIDVQYSPTFVTVNYTYNTTNNNYGDKVGDVTNIYYYELTDGRSSYNLTAVEVAGLDLGYDVSNYELVTDDPNTLSLQHFDGDYTDSSSYNRDFYSQNRSTTYVDSGSFGQAVSLPNGAAAGVTIPGLSSYDSLSFDFRIYYSDISKLGIYFGDTNIFQQVVPFRIWKGRDIFADDGASICQLSSNGVSKGNAFFYTSSSLVVGNSYSFDYLDSLALYIPNFSSSSSLFRDSTVSSFFSKPTSFLSSGYEAEDTYYGWMVYSNSNPVLYAEQLVYSCEITESRFVSGSGAYSNRGKISHYKEYEYRWSPSQYILADFAYDSYRNQWVSMRITLSGGNLYYFVNGDLVGSGPFTKPTADKFYIKSTGTVYLDELRVTTGSLSSTSTYTPSSSPYDTNKVLALPDDLTDNTIYVQNNISVTNYRIGGVRPSNPGIGFLYIPLYDDRTGGQPQLYDGSNWVNVTALVHNGDTTVNVLGYKFSPIGDSPDIDIDAKPERPTKPVDSETCTHEWEETSRTDATCILAGSVEYSCSKCEKTKTETLAKLGHTWEVKQSVQTSYDESGEILTQGFTIYRCSVCGEEYKDSDGSGPPGSSSGGEEGGDSLWDKLGELLGSGAGGFLELVGAFLGGILDGLIALVNIIVEKLGDVIAAVNKIFTEIPQLFAGFLAFLSAIFPFLPAEIMLLLTFGLAAVVFIGIIKAIRR